MHKDLRKYYVYEWIRLDTNEPFYVGRGKENRCYKITRGNNQYFNNIVKKIPVAVFILKDNLTNDESNDIECWYIHEYKYIIGYDLVNITDGGEGVSGYKASDLENKNNRMRTHGFNIEDHKDEIIDLYVTKHLSTVDIGKIFKVSKRCINSLLKRNNVKLRTSGETLSLNQTGQKRYNSKYIVIKNIKKEIVKVCESMGDFEKWVIKSKVSLTVGAWNKALQKYKNTENNYKGYYFYVYSKEEFFLLNIDKTIEREVKVLDFNNKYTYNSVIVEVYDTGMNLLIVCNSNEECINWLISTSIVNNKNSAKNAIDRCIKSNKFYKNTYYFKKYTKSQYNFLNNQTL